MKVNLVLITNREVHPAASGISSSHDPCVKLLVWILVWCRIQTDSGMIYCFKWNSPCGRFWMIQKLPGWITKKSPAWKKPIWGCHLLAIIYKNVVLTSLQFSQLVCLLILVGEVDINDVLKINTMLYSTQKDWKVGNLEGRKYDSG